MRMSLGLSHGVGRAERGDEPQGFEPNGDELMARDGGLQGPRRNYQGAGAASQSRENSKKSLKFTSSI